MIINELAGSGGDMMPWMFRYTKTGTLVGKRTWGGLIGVLGYPDSDGWRNGHGSQLPHLQPDRASGSRRTRAWRRMSKWNSIRNP